MPMSGVLGRHSAGRADRSSLESVWRLGSWYGSDLLSVVGRLSLRLPGRSASRNLLIVTAVIACGTGVVRPALTSLITQETGRGEQGSVLGLDAIAAIRRADRGAVSRGSADRARAASSVGARGGCERRDRLCSSVHERPQTGVW